MSEAERPWYRELNRYHWFVLVVCTMGWFFDCLDQQLFALARQPAVAALLGVRPSSPEVAKYSGYATSVLLFGWATGGIAFGIMGDRLGRARTMVFTILFYSVFTGLSGFAQGIWDFTFYRFMTGLGVGGQFAVGVSLVAEVMPDRARPHALGMLQALSAVGNVCAALISMGLEAMQQHGMITHAWRWMFAVGILPALLAVLVMRRLKEPERWRLAMADEEQRKKMGSLSEMFGNPRWRRHAILGMILGSAGVIGLWGIGFFSIDLNRSVFRKVEEQKARAVGQAEKDRQFFSLLLDSPDKLPEARKSIQAADLLSQDAGHHDPALLYETMLQLGKRGAPITRTAVLAELDQPAAGGPGQSAQERKRREAYLEPLTDKGIKLEPVMAEIGSRQKTINGVVGWWGSITSMLFNLGAFFGIYAFSRATHHIGRRRAFALTFLAAMVSTAGAFWYMRTATDVYWMVPLMGFCQLAVFGGYAIYFPELFPTRLRSTGVSFCYNIGRYAAISGPSALGLLTSVVFVGKEEPLRYAGVWMCSIFVIGLLVLPLLPETKGQPLPE